MYVSCRTNNCVTKIQINAGTPPTAGTTITNWVTTASAFGITNDGSSLFVSSEYTSIINQINLNGTITNTFTSVGGPNYCCGLALNNFKLYNANVNIYEYQLPLPCFKEDTKILTNKGYIPIQELRKGDLIQTLKNGFVPIEMIGTGKIVHSCDEERIKNKLYKYETSKFSELTEDLIITGCHSVLKDVLTQEQGEKTMRDFGDVFLTDDKIRLCAYLDEGSSVYEKEGEFTIYHLALENNDYYMNYGIYANGLLVESCSIRYLKELSNMRIL